MRGLAVVLGKAQRPLQQPVSRLLAAAARIEEAPVIPAELRDAAGTAPAERLRKIGRTPATLFSLPGNQSLLISLDCKEAKNVVARYGAAFTSRIFDLQLKDSVVHRVLPKQIHRNAVSNLIENITFLHCPEDRRVKVRIPVLVTGLELSPGARRGGWVNTLFPTVHCECSGSAIPPHIEVDVAALNVGQGIPLKDVRLPQGVKILEKAPDNPVCKMRGGSAGS